MAYIKNKNGVEIYTEEQYLKICVPSFSTTIIVPKKDKSLFINYLKYIHNKYNLNRYSYRANSIIQYGKDEIYFGDHSSVKYPKFGNFLEINKIPVILNLLNCNDFEYCSIISIIKKIKKIKRKETNGVKLQSLFKRWCV